jgi:hypothetical protein
VFDESLPVSRASFWEQFALGLDSLPSTFSAWQNILSVVQTLVRNGYSRFDGSMFASLVKVFDVLRARFEATLRPTVTNVSSLVGSILDAFATSLLHGSDHGPAVAAAAEPAVSAGTRKRRKRGVETEAETVAADAVPRADSLSAQVALVQAALLLLGSLQARHPNQRKV